MRPRVRFVHLPARAPQLLGTTDFLMTQQTQKLLGLLLLVVLLAYVSYLTFRAYLGPDFLIGFANLFNC